MDSTYMKVLGISFVLMFIVTTPVIVGYIFSDPPKKVFMGFDFPDDQHFHASFVKDASEGKLLLENKATTEEQKGVFLLPHFTFLGIVYAITGLPIDLIMNLFRIFIGMLFFIVLYQLLGFYFENEQKKIITTILVAFSGGIGWFIWIMSHFIPVLSRLKSWEISYYMGYNTFSSIMYFQNYLAYSAFLAACIFLLKYQNTKNKKFIAYASVITPFIFLFHLSTMAVFYAILFFIPILSFFIHLDIKKAKERFMLILPLMLSCIPLGFYLLWAQQDLAFSQLIGAYLSYQRYQPVFWYPIGFGFILFFALFGIRYGKIKNELAKEILYSWLFMAFFFAINPWKGLRFLYVLHAPLVIFAVMGLYAILEKAEKCNLVKRRKSLLLGAFIILSCLSAPLILKERINDVLNQTQPIRTFLSQSEISSISHLENLPKGNVLSTYNIGNYIIYLTKHKTFLGHWNATINFEEKQKVLKRFFSNGETLEWKKKLLEKNNITYIFYGKDEKALGKLDPKLPIIKIFEKDDVEIYMVQKDE